MPVPGQSGVRRAELGKRHVHHRPVALRTGKRLRLRDRRAAGQYRDHGKRPAPERYPGHREQWAGRSPVWRAAEEAGEVFSVGETVKGATEGWWVPEYLVKGDPQRGIEAKAPELRSVADLPRYKALFRDPEEPAKGVSTTARPVGPARSSTARSSRPTGCRTATRTSAPAPARRWMRRSVRPSGAVSRCFSTIGRRLR